MKNLLTFLLLITTASSTYAYQDCIVINKDKLTDINIEDNSIIDVFPLVTVNNDKNILIVHPLKAGKTRFCVLRDNKNLALFSVESTENQTFVNSPEGLDVFTLDTPNLSNENEENLDFILDEPPLIRE